MTNKIIFQETLLVSGIMCLNACGGTVHRALNDLIKIKNANLLPHDAQISIDAEPQSLGVHRLFIIIESHEHSFSIDKQKIINKFKESLEDVGFPIIEDHEEDGSDSLQKVNWLNIVINVFVIAAIITLSIVFPPSLPLTLGLIGLSFVTTVFTARHYFFQFFRNWRANSWFNMPTAISLGWGLSLAHALYHSIAMPLMFEFSMTFMNFIMPVMLITIVNIMDEIQRFVVNATKKMHLRGLKVLFPSMEAIYYCYELSEEEKNQITHDPNIDTSSLFNDNKLIGYNRSALKENMFVQVKRGNCFPVDGDIVQGRTLIDASIINGEPSQLTQLGSFVPAGAINLGPSVIIRAKNNCYNSTINSILFRSNRASPEEKTQAEDTNHRFTYSYGGLIVVGIALSLIIPLALGSFTIPLMLQSLIGTLFGICPCTIVIVHLLPKLLAKFRLQDKGIVLRDDHMMQRSNRVHTVVFDKTGTLTTGNSEVESSHGHSASEDIPVGLWQRIYLLEEQYGLDHPLARAICRHCEANGRANNIRFNEITGFVPDPKNRGLSAKVQNISIDVGNLEYLKDNKIKNLPDESSGLIHQKLNRGCTPVYIAEGGIYKGVIFIKHEVDPDIVSALRRLKSEGTTLIMLTGDKQLSAEGFNQQIGGIFDPVNIHAEKTPEKKEIFLQSLVEYKLALMSNTERKSKTIYLESTEQGLHYEMNDMDNVFQSHTILWHALPKDFPRNSVDMIKDKFKMQTLKIVFDHVEQTGCASTPRGVWFVGDGLNDASCARMVSDNGGVSCAMRLNDKAAFFTDVSLNGSLDYLFEYQHINHMVKKTVIQNQWLLGYGALLYLTCIIALPIVGIGVTPLIPVIIMVFTTGITLFNSARIRVSIDSVLDKKKSWVTRYMASDLSLGLLITGSLLLASSFLIMAIISGHLVMPMFAFTAGLGAIVSSSLLVAAVVFVGAFVCLGIAYCSRSAMTSEAFVDRIEKQPARHQPMSRPQFVEELNCRPDTLTFGLSKLSEKRSNSPCHPERNESSSAIGLISSDELGLFA
ncbi:MAG: HAD family hydrolase [Legionellaceae bacterium]|nr:HAD family hydrolase [Legionellaceae bacterium]